MCFEAWGAGELKTREGRPTQNSAELSAINSVSLFLGTLNGRRSSPRFYSAVTCNEAGKNRGSLDLRGAKTQINNH